MWIETDNGHYVNGKCIVALYIVKENITEETSRGREFTRETIFKVKAELLNGESFTLRAFKNPLLAERYRERLLRELQEDERTLLDALRLIARCINVTQAIEEGA